MKKTAFLCLSIFLLSFGTMANEGGSETGNGGDFIAQDFATSANDALEFLGQHSAEFPFIDIAKIRQAMVTAKLTVLPPGASFSDAVRTAENFPQNNEIKINSDRWVQIQESPRKMALSLHEYLGLTGYEVNNYIITSQLFGIAHDQMEAPPTIEELDHSFDFVRPRYLQLLAKAKNQTPNLIPSQGQQISKEECEAFTVKMNDYNVTARCSVFDPQIYIYTESGKTSLQIPYSNILQFIVQDPYGPKTVNYFYDENGRVVEKSATTEVIGARDYNYVETDVALLDKNGDAYEHDITSKENSEHSLIEEFAGVVLSDGSLGGIISEDEYVNEPTANGDPVTRLLTLSVTDSNDWQAFQVRLNSSVTEDLGWGHSSVWGDNFNSVSYVNGMEYSYNYLGQQFPSPDNWRTIGYFLDEKGVPYKEKHGSYIANRRAYSIDEGP